MKSKTLPHSSLIPQCPSALRKEIQYFATPSTLSQLITEGDHTRKNRDLNMICINHIPVLDNLN